MSYRLGNFLIFTGVVVIGIGAGGQGVLKLVTWSDANSTMADTFTAATVPTPTVPSPSVARRPAPPPPQLAAAPAVTSAAPEPRLAGAAPPSSAEAQRPIKAVSLEETAQRYFPGEGSRSVIPRLLRLTREQIDITVGALLPERYIATRVKAVMPRDPLKDNYEYGDMLALNSANLFPLADWITGIAERVAKEPTGVIDCQSAAEECLRAKGGEFVRKAFRNNVTDAKVKKIADFYVTGAKDFGFPRATADLVAMVLNLPDFLFRAEPGASKQPQFVAAERLQSISYTLADSPPSGLGLNPNLSAAAAVDKVMKSKLSRDKFKRFVMSWLEIVEPGEFRISKEKYPQFDAAREAAMLQQVETFLEKRLFANDAPRLKDITQPTKDIAELLEEVSPAAAPSLMSASAPRPSAAPKLKVTPRLVTSAPQRLGIFSEPAVIASHSGPDGTRPIRRGVFWARKVLCLPATDPPKALLSKAIIPEIPDATERERIKQATSAADCRGCHHVIDRLGFFQEKYDALGNWRTREDNSREIDTRILIDFLGDGSNERGMSENEIDTESPVEALQILTQSTQFKQCFVRQMFRFYMGRDDEEKDHPVLKKMFTTFMSKDENILETLKTLALTEPTFASR